MSRKMQGYLFKRTHVGGKEKHLEPTDPTVATIWVQFQIHGKRRTISLQTSNYNTAVERWEEWKRSGLEDASEEIDFLRWLVQRGEAAKPKIFQLIRGGEVQPHPHSPDANVVTVTVPKTEEDEPLTRELKIRKQTEHTEIQWHLLELGAAMGLDLWVARNDRNREWEGQKLSEFPRLAAELPRQFDEATMRTIELIDVIWLEKKNIVAAFEIEHTTSIYSGLLRMSDLMSMQPNLKLPLYLVAPDERREKVIEQVNRATFSALRSPLSETCRFIPYGKLKGMMRQSGSLLKHLKPGILADLSDPCRSSEA